MESLLNRYRNITVLLLAIFAQLVLLAYQVKSEQDVPMIRVWAVSAVTPLAKVLEVVRSGTMSFVQGYITLHDTRQDNMRMKEQLDKLKMENQYLKTQLDTADRAKALVAFQAQTQSKALAARIIALGAGFNSKVVFVDRGSTAGVQKGMAVVTPDGIVGKVLASYPTASQVQLITDPNFAAGVISQKHHARGTFKGQGNADGKVDYVQNEQKVEVGEWFYTSGDDRIFPRGFPAGVVRVVRAGQSMKEISVEPSGLQHGLEEVLILIEGVHQAIPEAPVAANEPVYMLPPPPTAAASAGLRDDLNKTGLETDADRLRERYKQIGDAQKHTFGEGLPGSKPPDFNIKLPVAGAPPAAAAEVKPEAAKPEAARSAVPPGAATRPEAPKPEAARSAAPPGAATRPDAPKPEPARSVAPPGAVTRPEAPKPDTVRSVAPQGAVTKPEAPKPDTVRSAAPPGAAPPKPEGPRSEAGRSAAPPKPGVATPPAPRPERAPAQKKQPEPAPPEPKPTKPIDPFL